MSGHCCCSIDWSSIPWFTVKCNYDGAFVEYVCVESILNVVVNYLKDLGCTTHLSEAVLVIGWI